MRNVSPAGPCWCGSGQPYQQCHQVIERRAAELQQQGYWIPNRRLIKTAAQLESIRRSGRLTTEILDKVGALVEPGVSTATIDTFVHQYTLAHGAYPAPLNYKGFPKSVCTSVNQVICHGIPCPDEILREGDIINIDVTTILDGFYADASRMYLVGKVSPAAAKLVRVAQECLRVGVNQVKPFESLNAIGNAIEPFARLHGYSVVRELGGHGTGVAFHEPLHVDHFVKAGKGYLLLPGMVFTVEPMINAGGSGCRTLNDGWTVVTQDGSLSAQWEQTVAVTRDGVEILAG